MTHVVDKIQTDPHFGDSFIPRYRRAHSLDEAPDRRREDETKSIDKAREKDLVNVI
jgi:hypothetical protein